MERTGRREKEGSRSEKEREREGGRTAPTAVASGASLQDRPGVETPFMQVAGEGHWLAELGRIGCGGVDGRGNGIGDDGGVVVR